MVDLDKVVIGFEALAIDVLTQTHFDFSTGQHVPFSANALDSNPWFPECTVNMTRENEAEGLRCGNPVISG